jgi:hypothetical protein
VVNTTGNPEGGEKDPASTPQTEPSGHEDSHPEPLPAGAGEYGSEPLGEYGYTGGYGYGPGYGDPDGGGGYSYGGPGYGDSGPGAGYGTPASQSYAGAGAGEPGYAEPAGGPGGYGPPGGGPASAGGPPPGSGGNGGAFAHLPVPQALPVVAATPALKGFPGGPGIDTLDDTGGPDVRGLNSPSVWQNAQRAWRDSGVEWQRPVADYEAAEAEWERVQATPPAKRRAVPSLPGRASPSPSPSQPGRLPGTAPGGLSRPLPSTGQGRAGQGRAGQGGAGQGRAGQSGARPAKRSGGRLHVRRGVWLTALVIVVVAALVAGGLELFRSTGHPAATGPRYPAATPATGAFATSASHYQQAQGGRNVFQSVNAVAEHSGTVIAAGAEIGQWVPRTEFLVSANGGRTWKLATLHPASGPAPSSVSSASATSAAIPPQFIAHGPGGWAALGDGAYWTSPDGTAWTQASGTFPLHPGDQVAALAATSKGFIAVGDNVPHGDGPLRNPIMWTSPNGLTWQRLSFGHLHLPFKGSRILRISGVAARGSDVLAYGSVLVVAHTKVHGHEHTSTSVNHVLWQSGDGGSTWTLPKLPLGAGTINDIAGVAATGAGLVAIRPASSKTAGSDAVAFTSPDGASWTRAGTITATKPAHLTITSVSGSDQGVVAVGQESSGVHVAFVSTNGASWQSVSGLGSSGQTLAGATMASGGAVVVGGYSAPSQQGQSPFLAVGQAGQTARQVSFASIPGATGPSLNVAGLTVSSRRDVAVGTANGYPAIWSAASGGSWTQVSSPALSRPGMSTLTSVAHGTVGWVAAGATITAAPVRPIVVTSGNGTTWQSADGESVFSGPGITLHGAAASSSGYVVAGGQAFPASTTTKTTGKGKHKKTVKHTVAAHSDAVIYYSSGLTGWTTVLNNGSGGGTHLVNAVTANGAGFVAVGSIGDAPSVWTSPDGRTWKQSPLSPPTGATAAALQQVSAHGKMIVATGTETTSSGSAPFAEYSTDGGTLWQPEHLSAPASPATVTALAAAGKGFVAVGTAGPLGSQHVVVWWTTTGFSWKTIQPHGTGMNSPGSQAITALAASGSTLTGTGYLVDATGEHPTLWTATAGP